MSKIQHIRGAEILDSRGNPTVAATVVLQSGATGYAAVPSGASTGTREAVELRDNDSRRYGGKGVTRAIGHVNGELREALSGLESGDQAAVDRRMIDLDGTPNKARLGANAILAVSMALAKANAADTGIPLYRHLAQRPMGVAGADDEHPQRRRTRRQQRRDPGVHDPAGGRAHVQ